MDLSIWEMLILSLAEGLSEILPLSGDGLVFLVCKLLGILPDGAASGMLSAVCMVISAVVILLFFRKDWVPAFRPRDKRRSPRDGVAEQVGAAKRLVVLMTLGLIPVIGSLVLQWPATALSQKPLLVAVIAALGGFLVFSCDRVGYGKREIEEVNFGDGVLMALAQTVGCIPGIPAAGIGAVVGIWRGLSPEFSVKLSCLMLVPRLLVQGIWKILANLGYGVGIGIAAGALFCVLGTYIGLRLFCFASARKKLGEFAYWTWGISLFLFILYLFG